MTTSLFGFGCAIFFFGIIAILHNEIGIFPVTFPHFQDTTSIIAIGLAIITLAIIFKIPTKK